MNIKCEYENISFKDILTNIDKYSKEFSEGNELLEITLKLLWKNDIKTKGCCKGHDNKKQYIAIDLTKNKDIIINLLSSLNKKDIHISFVSMNNNIGVSIKKYKDEDIFKNIIESLNLDKIDNNIKTIIENIINRNNDSYYNLHLYYNNNKLVSCILNTNDSNIIKKYIKKCEYKMLNEKLNMYQFKVGVIDDKRIEIYEY